MELSRIDLSAIAAVGHDDEHLGLLIERDKELEYLEVLAPIEAYEGLQEVAALVNEGPKEELLEDYYYDRAQEREISKTNGLVYKYQRTVEIKVSESLSVVSDDEYESYYYEDSHVSYSESTENENAHLTDVNYDPDSQFLRLEFDDGSIYEYDEVDVELWEKFKNKTNFL